MLSLPGAQFARIWGTAALLSAVLITGVTQAKCETMRASWYGAESGSRTASGAPFRPMGFTAAHLKLPFGTRLNVCFRGCVIVTINDRGPAKRTGNDLDLSKGAALAIGLKRPGVGVVRVQRLN